MKKYLIFLFLALLATAFNAYSATLQVTNSNDAGWGSLRERIAFAPSGDTIIFAPNVNYITLTSGQIEINKTLTINGGDDPSRKVTIDGNNNSRIFEIRDNINHGRIYLIINNLTLTNGRSINYGGAIYIPSRDPEFSATNCTFNNNSVTATGVDAFAYGGAICSFSNLSDVTNCTFNNNSATATGVSSLAHGGAVYIGRTGVSGNLTAINCTFTKNSVTVTATSDNRDASASGGAAYVTGNASFTSGSAIIAYGCSFTENTANAIGASAHAYSGGVHVAFGSLFAAYNYCVFSKNTSSTANTSSVAWVEGGSTFSANDCTFAENENTAANNFVVVVRDTGSRDFESMFLANNCTFTKGGAVNVQTGCVFSANGCTFTENKDTSMHGGGAVKVGSGAIFEANNSIFSKNTHTTHGGAVGVYNAIYFLATNCTFNENTATSGGGAIYNVANINISSNVYLYHCTFDGNQAPYGNAIGNTGTLYSYNCVYTGDIPQIVGNIMDGDNLIEGVNAIVTRNYVFGTNQFNGRYITPLPNARAAKKLDNTIQVPARMTADEILNKLAKDQIGNPRPIE